MQMVSALFHQLAIDKLIIGESFSQHRIIIGSSWPHCTYNINSRFKTIKFKKKSTFSVFTKSRLNTKRVGGIRDSYADNSPNPSSVKMILCKQGKSALLLL